MSSENKIMNLIRFTMLFSHFVDNNLEKSSPDYILEKYNSYIGFKPKTQFPVYTPDDMTTFILKYHKTWKDDANYVKRQLLYLKEVEYLNFSNMVTAFKKYFGPIELITDIEGPKLHTKIEAKLMSFYLDKYDRFIEPLRRELKLNELGIV